MDDALFQDLSKIDITGARWIASRLDRHGVFDVTVMELASDAGIPENVANEILGQLVSAGVLTQSRRERCRSCGAPLESDEDPCENCGQAIGFRGAAIEVSYFKSSPRGRDVPWMVLIHGMNTRGAWQEEFSWRAAMLHGRSIPIFSYKYGKLRPAVMIPSRRKNLVRKTISMIRELAGDADDTHLGSRPDVIAHSFGTWLIVQALIEEPTLIIGRLVLTGSILPRDFKWERISSQHQGVLNHYAEDDRIVGFARYIIPRSGPSGSKGFFGSEIEQVMEQGWGHSDFFKPSDHLSYAFIHIWRPFFTRP
jgi:pimeloyl-ACP methyl ester carboxylesterase